jgi:hypothetical protein
MKVMRLKKQKNWANNAVGPVRLFALVFGLLVAQALGFMHGIEHVQRVGFQTAQFQSQSNASGAHTGWVTDLFAGHDGESTCQVFDQLSQGNALLAHASAVVHLAQTSFFLDTYRGATPPHQRSLIQARGPPAVFAAS